MIRTSESATTRGGSRGGRVRVDATDLAILRLLATDARMSFRRLARALGVSPPTITDRVARLERLGVIRGYRVEIDRSALGFPLIVYVGVVAVQGSDQFELVKHVR